MRTRGSLELRQQCRYVVLNDDVVAGQERETFVPRLSDEHTVKWISVKGWQTLQSVGVLDRDRQRFERLTGKHVSEVLGQIELANSLFDSHLPDAGGAEKDQILRRRDQITTSVTERCIIHQPPQEKMRIKQDSHGSMPNAAAISGGSSSKPSWITIRPFSAPGTRLVETPVYRTSFATGTPALPIKTSSPLLTASMSAESSALASDMFFRIIALEVDQLWSDLSNNACPDKLRVTL